LSVAAVHDVDHPLGIAVAEVRIVGWAVVDHRLVDGVARLVREDAVVNVIKLYFFFVTNEEAKYAGVFDPD
jgi:hypothetical protein